MTITRLLTIHAVLMIALGIAFGLYGPLMIALFGIAEIPSDNSLLYWNVVSFARLFGGALFGFGFLLWAIRSLPSQPGISSETQRGIVFALVLANAMALFVAVTQQFSIWESPAGWALIALFGVLCLAYSLLLVARPQVKTQTGQ